MIRSRFVSAALLALGLAFAPDQSRAATLSLVMDDLLFDPGDPVTIRLVGDSQGGTDNSLLAMAVFDANALQNVQLQRFRPETGTAIAWTQGGFACNAAGGKCALINTIYQDFAGGRVGVDPAQEPFTYAVLTATAGYSGTYSFEFATHPTIKYVDFFGLSSAPGLTFTVTGDLQPPPPPQDSTPPPVVTSPPPDDTSSPPDDTSSPRPPSPIYTTGNGAGGDPIPEPTAALLFAAGLVCVQIKLRTRANTR